MRIIEGIVHPAIVIIGWIFALIAIPLIAKFRSDLSNQELSLMAALGGFVFIVQSLFIMPIQFIPFVIFTLSGITFVITVIGVTRGLLVAASAMILNHFLIPGSLSMLGTNLSNMIIAGLIIGWFPSQVYRSPYSGKKLKFFAAFIAGFLYTIIEGVLVVIELVLFYNSDSNIRIIGVGFVIYIIFLGLIEGIFTAIAVSYYYKSFQIIIHPILETDMLEDEDTEIQKIDFSRFLAIKNLKIEPISSRRSDFE